MYRGKRFFDVLLVTMSAPVWMPLLCLTALFVRFRLGKPVFFRQVRIGLNDAPFELVKFRTMIDARDSEGRLLPDEQRLTRFGRLLRSTSLDELPELLNVLRGEMSLVGPRPLLVAYLPRYSQSHRRRHLVRPGLTGLAQVSGRNAIGWSERFDLDVTYVDSASLLLDLKILASTLTAVLNRHGVSAPGDATMPPFEGYDNSASR